MANVTLTQVSAALKEVYEPRIQAQYANEMIFGKRIEKTSDGISDAIGGKYLDFPIETARNPGISYRAESEALGNPGATPYVAVHVPVFAGYGRVRVTGHTMELAKTNAQAFADMTKRDMTNLKDAAVKDSSRIMYGDGTGNLGQCTVGATATNTVEVGNGWWITPGMEIDILNSTSFAALATGRVVTTVVKGSATSTVVTFDGAAVTTTTSHAVYRAGNYTSGTQREPTGIRKIADSSGSLHGVDPATYSVWAGVEVAQSGALTEAAMSLMCDNIRVNGGNVSAIFTSLGVRRAYYGLLKADRQFHNTVDFAGGYKALSFNNGEDIPVVADPDCPNQTMFFVTEKNLSIRQPGEWKFVDTDGDVYKWVPGYDMFDVVIRKFWEMMTYQRNSQGVLTAITEG